MQRHLSIRQLGFIGGGILILLSLTVFIHYNPSRHRPIVLPESSSAEEPNAEPVNINPNLPTDYSLASEKIRSGLPIQLKIPIIQVDAVIEYVGLTNEGAMDTPSRPDNVAWFNLGTRPGEIGSAVIAGHSGQWKDGRGSVFDQLRTLRPGDKLTIEGENRLSTTFIVRRTERYDPKADAADIFFSNDGKSHLNIITCIGPWDTILQGYSQRLVVFTDKE